MTTRIKTWTIAAVTALATGSAQAALLFAPGELPGPTLTIGFDAPAGSGLTTPVDVGVGSGYAVEFSTVVGTGSVGLAPLGAWVLGTNGDWAGDKTFAGVDGGIADDGTIAALVFDFATPVQGVGGMMNFDPDFTFGGGFPLPLYIAAFDADGVLLEGHEVPVFTPFGFNEGVFWGIGRDSADIARLVIEGPYAVVDDLAFTVPEPSTYAMLLAGLGVFGLLLRRRAGAVQAG